MSHQFTNNPSVKSSQSEGLVKRYVHQPLTIDHYGIRASILENGRVKIAGQPVPIPGTNETEYDEVEVPASFIFKLASALKMTREIKFVSVSEAAKLPADAE